MRASALVALASLLGAVFVPRPSPTFCGFYVSGADTKLFADATQVVLMRQGTRTVLSMQNDYKGPPEDFAMVVPVPVVLRKEDVKTLPRDVFARVDALSAPRLVEYWEKDPCAEDGMIGLSRLGRIGHGGGTGSGQGFGGGGAVTIEAQFEVGEYEIVILSAKDSSALDAWLAQNGYKIPAGAEPVLRPYVQRGSKFFVAKVNAAKVAFEAGRASLSPLRFHYDSERLELPVRLGLLSSSGTQDLVVQILAEKRHVVANAPNVTIPTNLDVSEGARDAFGAFYAALLDKTLERNPGAVVTEYAWAATSCDPCPGGSAGLSNHDLVTLGADVLPSVTAAGGPQGSGGGRAVAGSVRDTAVEVEGKLPKEIVRRIVRQNIGRFRACYEAGLRNNPSLAGAATIRYEVSPQGLVSNATEASSTIGDATVSRCIRDAHARIKYPTADASTRVVYSLQLSPTSARISRSNLPGLVLTRLHLRYGKDSLGSDLVFKEDDPIAGGREVRGEGGALEQGATPAAVNNFQARYATRHAWQGPIACKEPRRGHWGGPWPDAGVAAPGPVAATKLAYAPREGVTLASFVPAGVPEIGIAAGPPLSAPEAPAPTTSAEPSTGAEAVATKSRCGCRAAGTPSASSVAPALAALAALLVRRRGRAARRGSGASP